MVVCMSDYAAFIISSAITIGFERTEYNVTEGGQTEVCALLMAGTLEKAVPVSVSSSDGTANGTFKLSDYSHIVDSH